MSQHGYDQLYQFNTNITAVARVPVCSEIVQTEYGTKLLLRSLRQAGQAPQSLHQATSHHAGEPLRTAFGPPSRRSPPSGRCRASGDGSGIEAGSHTEIGGRQWPI